MPPLRQRSLAVTGLGADGGIIITASHNPIQWNALKAPQQQGEFLSDREGKEVISIAEKEDFRFAGVLALGKEYKDETWAMRHIEMVKNLPLVDCKAIADA